MHVSQRVSVSGYKGTIRYLGNLRDSTDLWIGIEWDDETRGKHSGTHQGKQIFQCKAGSGSFLRASKIKFDPSRCLWEAVQSKYIDASEAGKQSVSFVPGISRPVEAIGFQKAEARFKDLGNVEGLFVSNCNIDRLAVDQIPDIDLSNITSLDVSWNLLHDLTELAHLPVKMPKLRNLKLEGNRFAEATNTQHVYNCTVCQSVTDLSLSLTLLTWDHISTMVSQIFPSVEILHAALNGLPDPCRPFPRFVKELDLHGNKITNLHQLLANFPSVDFLTISDNAIQHIPVREFHNGSQLRHLNLAGNPLQDLSDIANLSLYSNLRSLQYTLTFNTKEDEASRLLIIKHLPQLDIVNKTKVTQQEREDAIYFGEPQVKKSQTLADNVITLTFLSQGLRIEKKVLRHQTIKQLKTIYARAFKLPPRSLSYYDLSSDGVVEIDS